MNKSPMFIGSPGHTEGLAEKARRIDIDTSSIDGDVTKESLIEALRAKKAAGAVPLCPERVPVCIEAAAALRLPGIGAEWLDAVLAASLLTAAADKGVPCTQKQLALDAAAANTAAETLGAPLWVYPYRNLSGATRMRVEQLPDCVLAVNKALKHADGAPVCVQKAANGPLFRLLGFKLNREFAPVEVFEESLLDSAYVVPVSVTLPADLSGAAYQQLVAHAIKAARVLPFGYYLVEMEFILEDGAPVLDAIHLGHAPSILHQAVLEHASGIDLESDMLRVATGAPPAQTASRGLAAAGQWLTAPTGMVAAVDGVDDACAVPGVEQISVRIKPGDTLGHVVDTVSCERIGYILATGGRRVDAQTRLEKAVAKIEIRTTPVIS